MEAAGASQGDDTAAERVLDYHGPRVGKRVEAVLPGEDVLYAGETILGKERYGLSIETVAGRRRVLESPNWDTVWQVRQAIQRAIIAHAATPTRGRDVNTSIH